MENILPIRSRLSLPEIAALLAEWQRTRPQYADVRTIGRSGGYDIWLAELTDRSIDAEHKDVVLITAMHTGMEISGGNAVLTLGKWLLSDDPKARDILRKLVVVLIPCPNPFSYEKADINYQFRNEKAGDPYQAPWSFEGVSDPELYPEAEAVRQAIDRYEPDVLFDSHGVWSAGQIMVETISVSAFGLYKSFNRRIVDDIRAAAETAGYPQDSEDDRQRLLPTDAACRDAKWRHHFQNVKEGCTQGIYAYNKYHAMVMSIEVAFEESGFLRMRRLLEIGTERAPLEYYPGYPNRGMNGGLFHSVTAYGATPGQRRRSRVELWDKIGGFTTGLMHPELPGRLMYVCSTSREMDRAVFERAFGQPIQDFIGRLDGRAGFDTQRLRAFMEPDPGLYLALDLQREKNESLTDASRVIPLPSGNEPDPNKDGAIRHGIAFKLRIPYQRAVLQDVSLNGNQLSESETDGFLTWQDGCWTIVQVNVPPGADSELSVVTVAYDPVDVRLEGVFDPANPPDSERLPIGGPVGPIRPLRKADNP
ncbi:MAG: hypothetical protein J7639_34040 [Paenibacillaceae bacterium]|nr:hypothetical protein [Paenibacillaceae bacterium]